MNRAFNLRYICCYLKDKRGSLFPLTAGIICRERTGREDGWDIDVTWWLHQTNRK